MLLKSDPNNIKSFSYKARARRNKKFIDLLIKNNLTDLTVLDLGGTTNYWEIALPAFPKGIIKKIEIVNLPPQEDIENEINGTRIFSYAGNAIKIDTLRQKHYDLIFSNSVIEHVGNLSDQLDMANVIKGTCDYYFVQTPAKSFPIEPHFMFPFFAYFPLWLRATLHNNFNLGFMAGDKKLLAARLNCDNKYRDWLAALIGCEDTRLLTMKEFQAIFPNSNLISEKFFGVTKSYMATNMIL